MSAPLFFAIGHCVTCWMVTRTLRDSYWDYSGEAPTCAACGGKPTARHLMGRLHPATLGPGQSGTFTLNYPRPGLIAGITFDPKLVGDRGSAHRAPLFAEHFIVSYHGRRENQLVSPAPLFVLVEALRGIMRERLPAEAIELELRNVSRRPVAVSAMIRIRVEPEHVS